jgi:hypothetical protein
MCNIPVQIYGLGVKNKIPVILIPLIGHNTPTTTAGYRSFWVRDFLQTNVYCSEVFVTTEINLVSPLHRKGVGSISPAK